MFWYTIVHGFVQVQLVEATYSEYENREQTSENEQWTEGELWCQIFAVKFGSYKIS